jgi:hypothetical protein
MSEKIYNHSVYKPTDDGGFQGSFYGLLQASPKLERHDWLSLYPIERSRDGLTSDISYANIAQTLRVPVVLLRVAVTNF